MAITANDISRGLPNMPQKQDRTRWAVNAVSADWQGNEIVKADPGAGYNLYLTYIEINCLTAITLVLNADTTALLGPFNFTATTPGVIVIDCRDEPIQMAANTALQMDGSGTGAAQIYVEGFTV